jgi:DNA (cytosine-5)-methyltransferase 1
MIAEEGQTRGMHSEPVGDQISLYPEDTEAAPRAKEDGHSGTARRPVDVNLFAGAGGLALGIQAAGFSPDYLFEVSPAACKTLKYNVERANPTLRAHVEEVDARFVDWKIVSRPVRLLAGGVPCQPFSLGGRHRADQDGRNHFPEMLAAINALRPVAVLIENVRGLLRPAFRPYFEYILRRLEYPSLKPRNEELWQDHDKRLRHRQCSLGYEPEYHVSFRLVDAADYAVPQNRTRVFIVATRVDLPLYRFPRSTHSKDALLRAQDSGIYWELAGVKKPANLPDRGPVPKEDDGREPWVTVRQALASLPSPKASAAEAEDNHWTIPGARVYHGHKGSYLDWPSKAIKAGVHGVPGGENIVIDDSGAARYYTLREAARIQTFPDDHWFCGTRTQMTKQLGNAVPCRLAEAIARPLHEMLSAHCP